MNNCLATPLRVSKSSVLRIGVLTVIIFLAAFSVACQKPQSWVEYDSPNRDFTVSFPDKPNETTRTSPLSNGDVKYPKVVWTGKGVVLDISYSEIPDLRPLNPDEAKEYYEYLQAQTIKMNSSQLRESNVITVKGKSGHAFTEVRAGGKVTHFRYFLLGTKLLLLRAEQDEGLRPTAETNSTVEKFMTSLRFPD